MSIEATTEQTQAEPIANPTARDLAIQDQLDKFTDAENTLATCRAFWEKHKEAMIEFHMGLYGWRCTLDHSIASLETAEKKRIATAFGADGWKRRRDEYICGRINWHKTVDGIEIILEGAEFVKPELKEDVRIV